MTAQPRTILFKINRFKINPFKSGLLGIALFKSKFFKTRRFKVLLAIVTFLALLGGVGTVFAAGNTFNVTKTADTNDGSCDSSDCSLREAIIAANTNSSMLGTDTINVPAGTYILTRAGIPDDTSAAGDLDILQDVTIVGAGKDSTIINGNNLDRVFQNVFTNVTVKMSGMTITGGNGNPGGGVYNAGTATFDNVRFAGNSAGEGGALQNEGTATITNSEFISNSARGSYGGAISQQNTSATLILKNTIVNGNTAPSNGGGINMNGWLGLYSASFTNNTSFGGSGGGVLVWSGHGEIKDSTFAGNHSDRGNGGGLYFYESWNIPSEITNSTFSGNTAAAGGGINNTGTTQAANLTNVTIANNSSSGAVTGGGIQASPALSLKNSIVANNGPQNCTSSITSRGNNIDSGTSCGLNGTGDRSNTDPKLGPLQNNGGPTLTHALLSGSPAIDTGDATNAPSTDQRGISRPQDGNGDGIPVHDIGAFELKNSAPAIFSVSYVPDPVDEGSPATITVNAADPDGDTLSYGFDCNGDGDYTDSGDVGSQLGSTAPCTFDDNEGTHTVNVLVKDGKGAETPGSTSVTVKNVAPTATISNDGPLNEGSSATISFTDQSDASRADEVAGFRYEYHCDGSSFSGAADYATAGSSDSTTCTFGDDGDKTVSARIIDKDNEATEYTTNVTVNNVAPTANAQSVQTAEGEAKTITLTAHDPGSDTLSFKITSLPSNGKLYDGTEASGEPIALGPDGSYTLSGAKVTYVPDADYNGDDHFDFKAFDGAANSDSATVTITVTEVNDPPTATTDEKSVAEDSDAVAIDVLANDEKGPDNESAQTLSVSRIVSDPTDGTASVITEGPDKGKISYKPNADYFGPDSLTYEVCDDGKTNGESNVLCATGTVNITVTEVNDPPAGADDTKTTPENTPLVFPASDLLTDDEKGPDNESDQTLTVTEVTVEGVQDAHGTVSLDEKTGQITFTPETDYNGPAKFEYTVCDNGTTNGQADPKCSTQTATVNVTVTPVNSKPVANDGTETMSEDGAPIPIDLGALVEDKETSDADLTYTIVSGPASEQGTLSSSGPTFTFDSADNFNGDASFTYKVKDRGDPDNCDVSGPDCDAPKESDVKTVTIKVSSVNDSPTARDDGPYSVDEDQTLTQSAPGVLGNDSDIDGNALTVELVAGPNSGTLSLDAHGSFIYKPKGNFNGADSFTYKATDGSLESNEARVAIIVNSVNDLPTISDIPDQSMNENTATDNIPFTVGDVETAAADLTLEGSSDKQTLVPDANIKFGGSGKDRTVQVTPASNQSGEATITVEVKDADGGTATDTFKLTVKATNQPPVAQNDSVTTNQDTAVNVDVLANDRDPDGNTLTVTGVSKPSNGTASTDGKSVTYTPAANYSGSDSFTYTIDDGYGATATAMVDIEVVDNVAPSINCDRADGSWHKDDVKIACTANDAASGLANPDTDGKFSLSTNVTNGTETDNAQTDSRQICDKAGNCSTAGPIGGNKVDKKAPEVSITSPKDGDKYKLKQDVKADYSCADGGSGVDKCEGPVASGANLDTASVGQKTFEVKATDKAGNTASVSRSYSVVYDFKGFFQPVDNQPTLNKAKAGSAIPVKFSLGGDMGLDIFAKDADGSSYPKSQKINCDSQATVDNIEQTVNAGSSSLSYDASSGQYNYVWKTDKAWAGTCRKLTVKIKDGTVHEALFKFTN